MIIGRPLVVPKPCCRRGALVAPILSDAGYRRPRLPPGTTWCALSKPKTHRALHRSVGGNGVGNSDGDTDSHPVLSLQLGRIAHEFALGTR